MSMEIERWRVNNPRMNLSQTVLKAFSQTTQAGATANNTLQIQIILEAAQRYCRNTTMLLIAAIAFIMLIHTTISRLFAPLLLAVAAAAAAAAAANASQTLGVRGVERHLDSSDYYFTTTTLGRPNKRAVLDNPLKGLFTSPRYMGHNTPDEPIPSTLEFYYLGLSELMTGPNQFDWSVLDDALAGATERRKHLVLRVFVHYPDKPLRVPQFLIDQGIELVALSSSEKSPQYDDPKLLLAFRQFITALGAKYDGHKALGFLQLGLLGKWGEWHTYPETGLLSDATKDKVVGWYKDAFQITPLQVRNPLASAYPGMGLHDDSFAFSTLDGDNNGGEHVSWFFWSEVKAAGQTDFWRKSPMGGETRPEIQGEVFEENYHAGTPFKQDFMQCVGVTHATYMFHHDAFEFGAALTGEEKENALDAHVGLGYNYEVNRVAVKKAAIGKKVVIDVTVEQTGVAPFYYALDLVLTCDGFSQSFGGVETLIDNGDAMVFSFDSVPADAQCLDKIELLLDSKHVHSERPVRFAQGDDGRVVLSVPRPQDERSDSSETQVRFDEDTWSRIIAYLLGNNSREPSASLGPPFTPKSSRAKFFVDTGLENEDLTIVSGTTWQYFSDIRIKRARRTGYDSELFKAHRWGSDFTYTFDGLVPKSTVELTLGFAETFTHNCSKGMRVFSIHVNNQEFVSQLDVFDRVGCQTAYQRIGFVHVNDRGELHITFTALVDQAMVSLIEIDDMV